MSRTSRGLIVVADDEQPVLFLLKTKIEEWGFRFAGAVDKNQLFAALEVERPCLLILDLHFGSSNGIALLTELQEKYPGLMILLLTGNATLPNAVAAITHGAYDFLSKPPDWARLEMIVRHALTQQRLRERIVSLEESVEIAGSKRTLWGESEPIRRVIQVIDTVAPTDAPVLVSGESGTGKELVARSIHDRSGRPKNSFLAVNMAALPATLAESTLFGHERGAFTGADKLRIGCFEAANNGTLFLDEIGEMDFALQSKLLRVLQEHSIERVGSNKPIAVNCRVVAATNRNLAELVREKKFREDLYYRLNVVPIELPPLRQRRDDVPSLASRFLRRTSLRYQRDLTGFSPAALDALSRYDWPGNVRELENVVERLVIFAAAGSEIGVDALPAIFRNRAVSSAVPTPRTTVAAEPAPTDLARFEVMEREAIIDALQKANGTIRIAAKYLGIGQATIYRKLKRYDIDPRNVGVSAAEELAPVG